MDKIYLSALAKIKNKYRKGVEEHGGMDKAHLTRKEWLIELQAEAIDTVFYCEKLISMESDRDDSA